MKCLINKCIFVFTLFAVFSSLLQAQTDWPSKPLRIIVPVPPGSFTDIAARALAIEMSLQLGQQVIVENKAGAGTTIGADLVAKSAPDGYTMFFTENSFSISPALYPKLPYDSLKDFAPVTIVAEAPTILWARTDFPAKTVKQLVDLANSTPKLLSYASGGQGTSSHLAGELFFDISKIKVIHIPFKGVAASMNDVVARNVDFGTSSVASPMALIKAGRLMPIAISGRERMAQLPDVPTFAESGYPQYEAQIWFGMLVAHGTPTSIVNRLRQELIIALGKPKTKETFASQGATIMTDVTPQAFAARLEVEVARWRDLITRKGIIVQ
jgi:tripartite-type tricarboxylate transporter receptor subunit TctC